MSLREDYAAAFGAFDGVRDSKPHSGAFTDSDLRSVGGSGGRIVRTTRLSLKVHDDDPSRDLTSFGAYIFVNRGAEVGGEDDVAWLIARRIAQYVAERDAINVRARNALSKHKVFTAWFVSWDVAEDGFDAGALDAELHDLEVVHTDFVHDGRNLPPDTALPIDPPTDGDTAVTTDTTSP